MSNALGWGGKWWKNAAGRKVSIPEASPDPRGEKSRPIPNSSPIQVILPFSAADFEFLPDMETG